MRCALCTVRRCRPHAARPEARFARPSCPVCPHFAASGARAPASQVLSGQIPPDVLVMLPPEELASDAKKEENARIREKKLFDSAPSAAKQASRRRCRPVEEPSRHTAGGGSSISTLCVARRPFRLAVAGGRHSCAKATELWLSREAAACHWQRHAQDGLDPACCWRMRRVPKPVPPALQHTPCSPPPRGRCPAGHHRPVPVRQVPAAQDDVLPDAGGITPHPPHPPPGGLPLPHTYALWRRGFRFVHARASAGRAVGAAGHACCHGGLLQRCQAKPRPVTDGALGRTVLPHLVSLPVPPFVLADAVGG